LISFNPPVSIIQLVNLVGFFYKEIYYDARSHESKKKSVSVIICLKATFTIIIILNFANRAC